MNIELTRIARTKIEQMGGTPCGVLVCNEAGALACVSEHGRVTWLDGFEGQASSAHQELLEIHRITAHIAGVTELTGDETLTVSRVKQMAMMLNEQAARAQPEQPSAGVVPELVGEAIASANPDYTMAFFESSKVPPRTQLFSGKGVQSVCKPTGTPKGFALIPDSITLSYEDIENIMTMTGWDEGRDDFGEGVLWVGAIKDDDGNETWGLNISCIEVMEEGALPVHEFDRPILTAAPTAPAAEPRPLPVNRYGVDRDYFTKKLEILIRDMRDYTPAELARSLGRLAMTADSETMQEPELNTAQAVQGGGEDERYPDFCVVSYGHPGYDLKHEVFTSVDDAAIRANALDRKGFSIVKRQSTYTHNGEQPSKWRRTLERIARYPRTRSEELSAPGMREMAREALSDLYPHLRENVVHNGEQGGEWVRCDERLPTEADGNLIWSHDQKRGSVELCSWAWSHSLFKHGYITHWQPTGLTRPQPPKSKEGE